jgi:hypothetical protein
MCIITPKVISHPSEMEHFLVQIFLDLHLHPLFFFFKSDETSTRLRFGVRV